MRVHTDGITRQKKPFTFRFEGRAVEAYPGDTIASALIAAGTWDLRYDKRGAPRGIFCGMGVCGDCEVRIGKRSGRACLEPAHENLDVSRCQSPAPVAPGGETSSANWLERRPDVLIVGAGPAGLSAAAVAARAGLEVLIVDERQKAGGQYFKQPSKGFDVDFGKVDAQFAEGRQLVLEAREAGAKFIFGATVWGTFAPNKVAIAVGGQTLLIDPQRLILCPGAYERALPVPGWVLPGVLTTGAAQTLLRAHQVAAGKRVLIAGNGPLNLQVADELTAGGVDVVAVTELAAAPYKASPRALLGMALNAPHLSLKGLGHILSLRSRGVPIHYRHAMVAAEGDDKVRRAVIAEIDDRGRTVAGTEQAFDVDAVCVNYGFLPQSELARSLGCRFHYDNTTGSFAAARRVDGRTDVPNVFVVGDAGGMGGARIAMTQGTLAGLAVVADLCASADIEAQKARCERTLRRHRRFQSGLWRVFDAPYPGAGLAEASTLVCRCEGLDRGTIDECLRGNDADFGSIKRTTRLGMGRCQGRYCATLLASLMAEELGRDCAADEFFAPRAPFKPVRIAEVAGAYSKALAPSDLLQSGDD